MTKQVIPTTRHYTLNLAKGAAVLDEMRTLLLNWMPGEDINDYLTRVLASDLLGKRTAKRTRDLVVLVFYPRYIANDDRRARRLQYLLERGGERDLFREISFVYAAHADDLLRDFTIEKFRQSAQVGMIQPDAVLAFLAQAVERQHLKRAWSRQVQTKYARSMLGALRDFGLIREERRGRREVVNYRMTDAGVIYLAHELHISGLSDVQVVESLDWALFGMDRTRVLERLEELGASAGMLVQRAGSVVRITWSYPTMEAMIDAIIR
ncbi:hypothetical protein ANRL1_04231 [Anaerolineae bacterium]|nr:hypothetical protein ANRL1_04231 [Anaerolineae bacterium]